MVIAYILLSIVIGIFAGWQIKSFWHALMFVLCAQAFMSILFAFMSST